MLRRNFGNWSALPEVAEKCNWMSPTSVRGGAIMVNAYEGKTGMMYLHVKLCDACLSTLRYT